jgi:hypothetical protein
VLRFGHRHGHRFFHQLLAPSGIGFLSALFNDAIDFRVAVRAESPAVVRNGERGLLTAPYATNDILFVVHFWFAVGEPKLARVSLGTQYAADCPNVRSLLFSIYGAPQVSDLGSPSSSRWRSDATGNFIAFSQYGDTRCVLDYYPIPIPGPPGL